MTTIQSISDEIDKLVEANTLSGAGVKAMEALRVKVIALEAHLADTTLLLNDEKRKHGAAQNELSQAAAKLSSWAAREGALVKREVEITKLELEKAVAVGKTDVVRECFALVFRNAEIRETLRSATPVVYPSAGGGPGYTNVHETRNEVTKQQT